MKSARRLSVSILIVLCLAALYGSYYMISDPSGDSLGLPFYLLRGTIFNNYEIVGWILFYTVGLFSAIVILFSVFKSSIASFLVILQGVLLCIFIFVQMLLLQETFLIQYAFLSAGIGLIVLGAFQNQRKIESEE